MGTTTNHSLRYPENVSPVVVPADIKKLAEDVDAKLISSAGGTVSGNVAFTGITTAQTPSASNHVATKQYVDTQLSPVTATANGALPKSLVDAKGDILVGTANDTPARLAVGINGTLLTADSSTASGLKWTSRVFLEGTGSPEGVITAPPGSTYLQTDSVTDVKGWIRWIKATGTGNIGWIAGPEADTGYRTITSLASGASGDLKIRRFGNHVYLASYNLNTTTNGAWTVQNGFRPLLPGSNTAYPIVKDDGTAGAINYGVVGADIIDISNGMKSYNVLYFTWSWQTRDSWPTSLPGTAA